MLVNFSIFPIGKGESIRQYVAEAVDEIQKSGLDYRLTAMGTIMEGDWDAVMKVIKKARDRVLKKSHRLYLSITIDDKKGQEGRMKTKVEAVEAILGKTLRK